MSKKDELKKELVDICLEMGGLAARISKVNQRIENTEPTETLTKDDDVTLYFECGCRISYFVVQGRLMGGLACCGQHEAANQQLKNILPLTVVRVE